MYKIYSILYIKLFLVQNILYKHDDILSKPISFSFHHLSWSELTVLWKILLCIMIHITLVMIKTYHLSIQCILRIGNIFCSHQSKICMIYFLSLYIIQLDRIIHILFNLNLEWILQNIRCIYLFHYLNIFCTQINHFRCN